MRVKTILLVEVSAAMEAVIRGALAPQGFKLMLISRPLEVIRVLARLPGIELIIAACEPGKSPESVSLLLGSRIAVPMLLVLSGTPSRRLRPLLLRAAATLQWPFFPSDIVAAIARLEVRDLAI